MAELTLLMYLYLLIKDLRRMKKYSLFLLCVGFLVVGMSMKFPTNNDVDHSTSQLSDIILPDQGGIFRGLHFNMSKEDVSQKEFNTKNYLNQRRYMAYNVKLTGTEDEYEFADIYYDFDRQGLFRATVETFQENERNAAQLYASIKRHYDKIYGDSYQSDDGFIVWSGKDKASGIEFEIAMIDISSAEDAGIFIEYYVV